MGITKIRYNDEYCIVRDNGGEIIIAERLDGVEVSTGNYHVKYTNLPTEEKLPKLTTDRVEKNKLYQYKDQVICAKKDITDIKLIDINKSNLFDIVKIDVIEVSPDVIVEK